MTQLFGQTVALSDVTLEVHAGSIIGLLGPTGAGKSTLISLLQGLRRPSRGEVRIFGGDPRIPENRQQLGSTPQETALPPLLTVREVVEFVSAHFANPVPVTELLAQFGLTELERRRTGQLSGGQRRTLSVALAFAGRPALVLLDEPTTGLDVDARSALWQVLRERHEAGATLVVTSHYIEEIEQLADRVVVVDSGRILADDSLAGVLAGAGRRIVEFRTSAVDRIPAATGVEPGSIHHTASTGRVQVRVADSDAFIRCLVRSGLDFSELTTRGASLEEAFLHLTRIAREEPR